MTISFSPELGRWLSRDPIKEEAGYNLYAMVENNAVGRRDYLGLAWFPIIIILPPPHGIEVPGTEGDGKRDCVGASCDTDTVGWDFENIPEGCTKVVCGAVSLTYTPCDCTERELVVAKAERTITATHIKSGQKRTYDPTTIYHMIGRTIPGDEPSKKRGREIEATPWISKLGKDGNLVIGILSPQAHFKWYRQRMNRLIEARGNNSYKVEASYTSEETICYCCK